MGENVLGDKSHSRRAAISWDEILADFAKHQRSANLSEKTIENREAVLRMLAKRSGKRPAEITSDDLADMLTCKHARTGERLAQGTMQSERSYLQTFFHWAKKKKYRKGNPAKDLPKIKMARRAPRPFRIDQVDAMLDSGAYTRTRDIITIAALTGLRIGEIVKIRGEDIDRVDMMITTIRKGNLEHRVAITDALTEILDRYPTHGWWFPSPYKNKLFPNGGGHILMASASDAVSKAIRRAGIMDRRLTGHSLRHYLATTMLRNGAPIRVVQETLGHASLATTQLYTAVTPEELVAGVNVVPPIPIRHHSGRRA
jgi:integrase/recombinase XerD